MIQFTPNSFDEFVGNTRTKSQLIKMIQPSTKRIKNPKTSQKIIIIGPTGSGKTTLCDLICQTFGDFYDILHVKKQSSESEKKLKPLMENFMANRTIESFFASKSKMIILEDIDICMHTDRGYITYLQTLVSKPVNAIVVMTCCNTEEKKIMDLKKKVDEILTLNYPSIQDTFLFLERFLEGKLAVANDKLLKITRLYNGDIRTILNNIHTFDGAFDENVDAIAIQRQQQSMYTSRTFDTVAKLMRDDQYPLCDLQYINDPMASWVMYENFVAEIYKNRFKSNTSTYFEICKNVINTWIGCDAMENYMYKNSDWGIYNNLNVIKIGSIIEATRRFKLKKQISFHKYMYTQMLSQLALRSTYGKKMTLLKAQYKIYEIPTIFRVFDILGSRWMVEDPTDPTSKRHDHGQLEGIDQDSYTMISQYICYVYSLDRKRIPKQIIKRTMMHQTPKIIT
jgi:DNA polymerase III delta prime subunit